MTFVLMVLMSWDKRENSVGVHLPVNVEEGGKIKKKGAKERKWHWSRIHVLYFEIKMEKLYSLYFKTVNEYIAWFTKFNALCNSGNTVEVRKPIDKFLMYHFLINSSLPKLDSILQWIPVLYIYIYIRPLKQR